MFSFFVINKFQFYFSKLTKKENVKKNYNLLNKNLITKKNI
jgi:hypothetical protein